MKWVDDSRKRMHKGANSIGNLFVEGFHYMGLFAICLLYTSDAADE